LAASRENITISLSRKDAAPINRARKVRFARIELKKKIAKQEHNSLFSHFLFLRDIMPELEQV
jgi:hypothetical protein